MTKIVMRRTCAGNRRLTAGSFRVIMPGSHIEDSGRTEDEAEGTGGAVCAGLDRQAYAPLHDNLLFFGWQFASELDPRSAGMYFPPQTKRLYQKYLKNPVP